MYTRWVDFERRHTQTRVIGAAGAAVLISRGDCSFTAKAQHAQAFNASLVIIYNNSPGDSGDLFFIRAFPSSCCCSLCSQVNGPFCHLKLCV